MINNKENSKLKWCFLVTPYPLLMEFLAKLSREVIEQGDDCFLIVNSKMAEYNKLDLFPQNIRTYHKVNWCIENYKDKKLPDGFSWKEFFTDWDRWKLCKFNYEKMTTIVSQLYQFINLVFQKEKPDVIVYGMPGTFLSQVVYRLCQKYNITYLSLAHSRFAGRIDIFDSKYKCHKYEETFKQIKDITEDEKKFAEGFMKRFISHTEPVSYIKFQMDYSKQFPLIKYLKRERKMFKKSLKYLFRRRFFRPYDYESEIEFKYWIRHPLVFLKRKIKAFRFKNIFDKRNKNDRFFLYPLQVQPELSTSGLATYFCDQVNTITNIAFSLPFPYKLYVKEHPLSFTSRSKEFYQKIKKIPNVVLVSPNENMQGLIKESRGVVVLTSTVGIEAVLAGKPVYALGTVVQSYHPLCRNISHFEELKQRIEKDLLDKSTLDNLEDINTRFIISYFRNTISGDLYTAASDNDTNDYQKTYQEFRDKFL